MNTRPSITYLIAVPEGEEVVGMSTFNGSVFVATNRRVYKLEKNERDEYRLIPIIFDPVGE